MAFDTRRESPRTHASSPEAGGFDAGQARAFGSGAGWQADVLGLHTSDFASRMRGRDSASSPLRETSREAPSRAVVAIERARRKDRLTDPAALLEAWKAIYQGRWTLVESVESDGRRLLLARVNPPAQRPDHNLSSRERQVSSLLADGFPQRAIAYELDVAASTVAYHVGNIAKKLGAHSATDAVRILSVATPLHRPRSSGIQANHAPRSGEISCASSAADPLRCGPARGHNDHGP